MVAAAAAAGERSKTATTTPGGFSVAAGPIVRPPHGRQGQGEQTETPTASPGAARGPIPSVIVLPQPPARPSEDEHEASHFFLGTPDVSRGEIQNLRSQLRQEMELLRAECREAESKNNAVSDAVRVSAVGGAAVAGGSSSSSSSSSVLLSGTSAYIRPAPRASSQGRGSSRSSHQPGTGTTRILEDNETVCCSTTPTALQQQTRGPSSSSTAASPTSQLRDWGRGLGHDRGETLMEERSRDEHLHFYQRSSAPLVADAASSSVDNHFLLQQELRRVQSVLEAEREAHARTRQKLHQWADCAESLTPVLEKLCKLAAGGVGLLTSSANGSPVGGVGSVSAPSPTSLAAEAGAGGSVVVNTNSHNSGGAPARCFAGEAALRAIQTRKAPMSPLQLLSTTESVAQALCLWQEQHQDVVGKLQEDVRGLKLSKKEVMVLYCVSFSFLFLLGLRAPPAAGSL